MTKDYQDTDRVHQIMTDAGAKLFAEFAGPDMLHEGSRLEFWGLANGVIVLQLWGGDAGGCSHYVEGGSKWADLEADAKRLSGQSEMGHAALAARVKACAAALNAALAEAQQGGVEADVELVRQQRVGREFSLVSVDVRLFTPL